MAEQEEEVITLSSDDEDYGPPEKAGTLRVVHLPTVTSSKYLSTTLAYQKIKETESHQNGNSNGSMEPKAEHHQEDELICLSDDEEDSKSKLLIKVNKTVIEGMEMMESLQPVKESNTDASSECGTDGNGAEVSADDFKTDAAEEIKKLLRMLKAKITTKEHKTVTRKIWKKYNSLNTESLDLHTKLSKKIRKATLKLKEAAVVWSGISQLLEYMDMESDQFIKLKESDYQTSEDENTPEELAAKQELINKKIRKLEKELNKISDKIKELDEKDVDFNEKEFLENDHNSAFMIRERYIKMYMTTYYKICQITNSLTHTGRPTQKKLQNILHTTLYPEIEQAVQDYVNSHNFLFAPDFADIFSIVKRENDKIRLDQATVHELAVDLHKKVVTEIQSRRVQDTLLAFPPSCDQALQDPADLDSELARRLEENKSKGKSIKDVVDEFAELAKKQNLEAKPSHQKEDLPDEILDKSSENSEDEMSENEDNDDVTSSNHSLMLDTSNLHDEEIKLTAEYAEGPAAERLCDDEEDEEAENFDVQLNKLNNSKQDKDKSTQKTVLEPDSKKIKLE